VTTPDHRRDAKAGARVVLGHAAEQFDAARVEADLLARFAQRGGLRRRIPGAHPAAGKADLAGMILEVCGDAA
jgi:hypothetical protein